MEIITKEALLRKKSAPTSAEECRAEKIFDKLEATLEGVGNKGVGLAAIQIGIPLRVVIVGPKENRHKLINPEITRHGPEGVCAREGCLSLPGILVNTRRFTWVEVKYIDPEGADHSIILQKLPAIAV